MKCDKLKEHKDYADIMSEWFMGRKFYVASDVDPVLAEKDEAIAELKAKLENVQASMYCDVVDANMEIRRLKRALWLARAQAADGFATISRWTDYEDMHPDTKIGYRKWYKKFMHVKALCKAKAEEYK
jgi:hypothetical protein